MDFLKLTLFLKFFKRKGTLTLLFLSFFGGEGRGMMEDPEFPIDDQRRSIPLAEQWRRDHPPLVDPRAVVASTSSESSTPRWRTPVLSTPTGDEDKRAMLDVQKASSSSAPVRSLAAPSDLEGRIQKFLQETERFFTENFPPRASFPLKIPTLEGLFPDSSPSLPDLSTLSLVLERDLAAEPRTALSYAPGSALAIRMREGDAPHVVQAFPLLSSEAYGELQDYLRGRFECGERFLRSFGPKGIPGTKAESIEIPMVALFKRGKTIKATRILPLALFLPWGGRIENESHWSIVENWLGGDWGKATKILREFNTLFRNSTLRDRIQYLRFYIPEKWIEEEVASAESERSFYPVEEILREEELPPASDEGASSSGGCRPVYGRLPVKGASYFPLQLKETDLPERYFDLLRWGFSFWRERNELSRISILLEGEKAPKFFRFLPAASGDIFLLLIKNRALLGLEMPGLLPKIQVGNSVVPILAMVKKEKQEMVSLVPLAVLLPEEIKEKDLPPWLDHGIVEVQLLSEGKAEVVSVPFAPMVEEEDAEQAQKETWGLKSVLADGASWLLNRGQTVVKRAVREVTEQLLSASFLGGSVDVSQREALALPEMSEDQKKIEILGRVRELLSSPEAQLEGITRASLKIIPFEMINQFAWNHEYKEGELLSLMPDDILEKLRDGSLFEWGYTALAKGEQFYIQVSPEKGSNIPSPPLSVYPLIHKEAFKFLYAMNLLNLDEGLKIRERGSSRIYSTKLNDREMPLLILVEKGSHVRALRSMASFQAPLEGLARLNQHARAVFRAQQHEPGPPKIWERLDLNKVQSIRFSYTRGDRIPLNPGNKDYTSFSIELMIKSVLGGRTTLLEEAALQQGVTITCRNTDDWMVPFNVRPLIEPAVFKKLRDAGLIKNILDPSYWFGDVVGAGFFVAVMVCGFCDSDSFIPVLCVPVVSFEKSTRDHGLLLDMPGMVEGMERAQFLKHEDVLGILISEGRKSS